MVVTSYLLGLGGNRYHGRYGPPHRVLAAAVQALAEVGIEVRSVAPVIRTDPIGPGQRRFANGAVIVETVLAPPDMLARLKAIERAFGRRPGRRWGDRMLDLDVLLWSGGAWTNKELTIPHPRFPERLFALEPAAAIARDWRVPGGALRVRHLLARARR